MSDSGRVVLGCRVKFFGPRPTCDTVGSGSSFFSYIFELDRVELDYFFSLVKILTYGRPVTWSGRIFSGVGWVVFIGSKLRGSWWLAPRSLPNVERRWRVMVSGTKV